MIKKILIAGMLALAVASTALASTGRSSGRDDSVRAKKSSTVEHKARHAKRSHRRAEAEHVRRQDDSLLRATGPGRSSGEAEPGDDRGAGVEPGDDNGGGSSGSGRHGGGRADGSGHH